MTEPMFADKNGFHLFKDYTDTFGHLVLFWDAASKTWHYDDSMEERNRFNDPDFLEQCSYIGPCLSKTDIAEMRQNILEECMAICKIVADSSEVNHRDDEEETQAAYMDGKFVGASDCRHKISELIGKKS